jgi:hypothetical protein
MAKLVLIGLAALPLVTACATTSPPRTDLTPDVARSETCLRTGTRIALKDGECASVPGRSYSKDDLDRTGAITVDEALRLLDPSIQR